MTLEKSLALVHTSNWGLRVIDFHRLTQLGTNRSSYLATLQVISVWVKLNRPIEELLERHMNLFIVFTSHYIMVVLPIMHKVQMLFYRRRLLQWFAYLLNNPKSQLNIYRSLLILLNGIWVLGLWSEGDML